MDDVPISIRNASTAARRQNLLDDVPLSIRRATAATAGDRTTTPFAVGSSVLLVGKARSKELLWGDLTPIQRDQILHGPDRQ